MVGLDLEEDRPDCLSGCRYTVEESEIHTVEGRRRGSVVGDAVEDIVDIETDRIVAAAV